MSRARVVGLGLFALIASSGCGSSPVAPSGCTADKDCPTGARCQAGVCQAFLSVIIISPAQATTATRGTLHVEVQVSGGDPDSLELFKNDVPLVTLAKPFQFDWDTTREIEGSYRLFARVPAGIQHYDSDAKTVIVDRTAPEAPRLDNIASPTNKSPVPVTGAAEPSATVRVYEGATQLGQTVASATSGAWSVNVTLDGGTHALSATATDTAGNVSAPSSRSIDVDRSAPAVVSQVPPASPRATNVWTRDPITVTFSKAVLPSSLTTDSVRLSGTSGPISLKPFVPSGDGRTLVLEPTALPPVPDQLTAILSSAITDLAGNHLPPTSWSWDLPQWQQIAPSIAKSLGASLFLTTAVAPDHSVYMAWQDSYGPGSPPEVRRAADDTWTSLGLVTRGSLYHRWGCALAVDSRGRPVVAHAEGSSGSDYQLYVSRHDGSSWIPLGNSLNASATGNAGSPRLVIDSADQPVVAWSEVVGTVHHLFVKRWNGTGWDALGGETPTSTTSDVTSHDLAMKPDGALSIVYIDGGTSLRLVRFSGTSWPSAGNANAATTTEVGLAFDEGGVEVAAYVESGTVKVVRWASSFSGFVSLGSSLSSSGSHASIRFRPSGATGQQLVVAFTESSPAGPRVLGWNGSSWASMAESIATPANSMYQPTGPTLAVNSFGSLAYAWGVLDGPFTPRLFFERFNR